MEKINVNLLAKFGIFGFPCLFSRYISFSIEYKKRTVEDGLPLLNMKRMDMFPFLFCENKEDTKKVPPNIVEGTSLELITESTGKSGISD